MKTVDYAIADNVKAFSTLRHEGFSSGPYSSFNANEFCGDDIENVAKIWSFRIKRITQISSLWMICLRAKHPLKKDNHWRTKMLSFAIFPVYASVCQLPTAYP